MDKLNINIENINNEEQIIKLIFEELSQYKNIKISEFFETNISSNIDTKTLKIYNSIFKSDNYINNLKEINFPLFLFHKEDLDTLNELISINSIKNKLNLSLELPEFFINL